MARPTTVSKTSRRNETVKLLSEIQHKTKEYKRQVTTSQEVTTYQLPEVSQATARQEYILIKPKLNQSPF